MNELQSWIDNPDRDYAEGVALFAQYSKNKALVRYFQTGTARFRMGKLVYEIGKVAKTVSDERANQRANTQLSTPHQAPSTPNAPAHFKGQIKNHVIPDFILAAKKEVAALYALIDKRHRELYDLGTSNADDVVRHRKKILDERKHVIESADRLYRLKEEWFALEDGHARERVANEIREVLAAPLAKQWTICAPVHGTSLQTNVSGLTDLQLSKRRTQLRSSITKTQNMLQYQSIRKATSPTPMPKGPKRDEYEQKLKALKAEFKAVTEELARRAAN
ncbi:MAG: hypothetical protein K5890_02865 [Bacteroidales bacterium]|nr:hypothetical protein [Bacteroidales bacterium]